MVKLLVCVLAIGVLGCLGMWLFWHAVSALYYTLEMAFWFTLVCAAIYVAFMLIKSPPKIPVPGTTRYQICDSTRSCVYGFREEPTVKDMVCLNDDLRLAKLELTGEVVQLNNKSTVKILAQNEDAIKVKVADIKSKDNVFWVPRSSVIKSSGVFHLSSGQIQNVDSSMSLTPQQISTTK